MTFRLLAALMITGLVGLPASLQAAERPLHRAAERYEEAVEDVYDAVRKAHIDDYTVRLVKSLERLADDLEDASEDIRDPYAARLEFQQLASTHARVRELLARPRAAGDGRLATALYEFDIAWENLLALFAPRAPHHARYGPTYGPVYEPLPPVHRSPLPAYHDGYRFEFDRGDHPGWRAPPRGYGRNSPYAGGHGWNVPRHLDEDDYEDYVEELEERAEEARERREEQLEEWHERREEALEERRERYEDYRERYEDYYEDRRPTLLRRFLERL